MSENRDPSARSALTTGWLLLAVSLPLGLTLEALHAMKVEVYLGSALRRELWTLAHAHGNLLGLACVLYGATCERWIVAAARAPIGRLLRAGAVLMPLGFFLGGVMSSEGDPSLGVLLVPLGGLLLVVALARCALSTSR